MRCWLSICVQLTSLIVLHNAVYAQSEHPFTAPGSIILSGWEYGQLSIATPDGILPVQGPPGFTDRGYFVLPALAPGGDRIAWGLTVPDDSDRAKCDPSIVTCALPGATQYKSVMGVYSIGDKAWKSYGDFCNMGAGSAAFSPDGTKIAFEARMRGPSGDCDAGHVTAGLLILDPATGQFTQVPATAGVMPNARISWSPDGRHLAAQFGSSGSSKIVLIETGSWVQKTIAAGADPSWSPYGDWIAFESNDYGNRCMIMRPDGSGTKQVFEVGHRLSLWDWAIPMGAVWSPDQKTMSLTEQDFWGETDVVSVDLATGKVRKMPNGTPSVFGWVLERKPRPARDPG